MRLTRQHAWAIAVVVGLVLSTTSCVRREPGALTQNDADRVATRYATARNTPNLDILDEIYDAGVVVHDCSAPADIVGLPALKDYYANTHTAFPDFHITFDDVETTTDTIVFRWTISGTNTGPLMGLPPTGKRVQFSGVVLSRVRSGHVVEEWVYFNVLGLMQQLGFTMAPPLSGETGGGR